MPRLGDRVKYQLSSHDVEDVRMRYYTRQFERYFHAGRQFPAIVTSVVDEDAMTVDLQIFLGPETLWRRNVWLGWQNGQYQI